ncbi:MAG: hypothetical protein WED10_12800, partial [Brumimicrobium sp.]
YYGSIPTNFIIRLEVHEPYTEDDTLIFRDFHSDIITDIVRIPGPFSSDIIDTIYNIGFSEYPIFYNEPPQQSVGYRIIPNSSGTKWSDFDANLCDTSYFGDAVIVIE